VPFSVRGGGWLWHDIIFRGFAQEEVMAKMEEARHQVDGSVITAGILDADQIRRDM